MQWDATAWLGADLHEGVLTGVWGNGTTDTTAGDTVFLSMGEGKADLDKPDRSDKSDRIDERCLSLTWTLYYDAEERRDGNTSA
jgi:hypothetical protein